MTKVFVLQAVFVFVLCKAEYYFLARSFILRGLIFDLAADTSLTLVLVCLATVKTGEVSNGPT